MVGRQNYCAGTAKLLHTILPFNGTEKIMMIHYNDEALFREFVAKGKAYGDGTYDFTFEDRYIIYHVKDVALRYIALDKETGLASEVEYLRKSSKLYTKTTYYKLFARILYSIKYNGDTRYVSTDRMVMTPSETIDFIFRQVMPYHGYAVREEQIKLAHNMYEGFKTGRVSINEAEVGTGKSMAYLVAGFVARQASHVRNRFPVTIATSSIELQRAIVEKEIPNLSKMLQKFGVIHSPLTVSLRKGKEHYLCQRRYEEYYEQIAKFKKYQRTIEKFEALNDTEGLVDLDKFDLRPSIKEKICVKGSCRKCKYRYSCGYADYVDKTKSCDFDYQVTNHNMFLTSLKGGEDPSRPTRNILCPSWLVVIDEAHKLKSAAEDVFGVRFDEEAVRDYVKAVKTMKREYTDASDFKLALNNLLKANDGLFSALREKTKEDDYENGRNTLIKLTPILEEYLYELDESIGHVECMREEPENAPSLNIEIVRDTIMTMLDDDEMNFWIEEDDNGILSLCASPKNIANEMFKKIWDTHKSFVLTSGTMSDGSSFDYFKQENGIDRVPSALIRTSTTESPFDYQNHARLYIPGDMPQPDNQSEEYRQALADKIVELVKATNGHTAKIFVCIALSFSLLFVGVGFAEMTASLNFTGNVSFQHTGLYISNITSVNGVNITGYSGTTMNLTAVAGATMTITVTNPMGEIYYYHDYFAGNHTLTTDMKVGASVAPDGSITFTVTFDGAIANAQIVQFNFLTIPPSLEEPGTGGGNASNAINALKLIIGEKGDTGKNAIGLNKENNDKTFEAWCNQSNPIIHCLDTNTGGKNLSKIFEASGAQDVYFTMEWVSITKYNVYLYYAKDAVSDNNGKYIVTYKQEILYNEIEELWYASTENTFKGYAMVRPANHGYGVEVDNNSVTWYANAAELPNGAEIVGN